MNRTGCIVLWAAAALSAHVIAAGCAATKPLWSYAPLAEAGRDPAGSQRRMQEAVAVMSTDPARAETLLRDALTTDLYNGPAHNNLGTIYLAQGKLYEAAGEFEWARKLLPGHPDPRHNLALTLERAGRIEEAITTYKTAMEVYPDHLPTMQALARLQVRTGRADENTPRLLAEISLRGETSQWRDWARLRLAQRE